MKTLTRWLAILVLVLAPVLSAGELLPDHDAGVRKIASYSWTGLSGAAGILTIVVPANTSQRVYLVSASIECGVACSYTQTLNGTVTGGTAVTPVVLNRPTAPTDAILIYRDASVASGTALPTWSVLAATPQAVDLSHIQFTKSASAQAYTISTGTITGNATVSLVYVVR